MTHRDDLLIVKPSRFERVIYSPVFIAAAFGACALLVVIGYAFGPTWLVGLASWTGGCAFVLGAQTVAAHRRKRYVPQYLDRLSKHEPPPVPD